MFCKCQLYSMQILFSKWWLKHFSGGNHPPYPPSLTTCLTPPEKVTPICFHQNDRKWCSLDYLDGLGHFLFCSGVADAVRRVCTKHSCCLLFIYYMRNTSGSKSLKYNPLLTDAMIPYLFNTAYDNCEIMFLWIEDVYDLALQRS